MILQFFFKYFFFNSFFYFSTTQLIFYMGVCHPRGFLGGYLSTDDCLRRIYILFKITFSVFFYNPSIYRKVPTEIIIIFFIITIFFYLFIFFCVGGFNFLRIISQNSSTRAIQNKWTDNRAAKMLDRLTVRQPVREMDRLTDRRIKGQMERKKS